MELKQLFFKGGLSFSFCNYLFLVKIVRLFDRQPTCKDPLRVGPGKTGWEPGPPPTHPCNWYCTAKYYNEPHSNTLHCTALYCTALHCTSLNFTELHCNVLHCNTLHCTALNCISLYCFTVLTICTQSVLPALCVLSTVYWVLSTEYCILCTVCTVWPDCLPELLRRRGNLLLNLEVGWCGLI